MNRHLQLDYASKMLAMFDYFKAEYPAPVGQWSMSSRWKEVVDFRYAAQLTRVTPYLTIVESDILNDAVHKFTSKCSR